MPFTYFFSTYNSQKSTFLGDAFPVDLQREKLQVRLNSVDIHFVDFIHKCLTANPKDRITPEQVRPEKNPHQSWYFHVLQFMKNILIF